MTTNCDQPIGYFYSPEGEKIPAPCKQWNCPTCSKVKKNKLLDRVGRGFSVVMAGGHRVRAVTLTLGLEADNALMGKYFARFRAWLAKPRLHNKKYRAFRGINYFWTKEFTEAGKLHLHMLIDVYIPVKLIKKAWKWATYGTSTIVFITKIYNQIFNPAGYMTKYMSKELEQCEQFRRKERRFGFSRNWKSPFLLDNYRQWFKHFIGDFAISEYKFEYDPSPVSPVLMAKYRAEGKSRRDPPGADNN